MQTRKTRKLIAALLFLLLALYGCAATTVAPQVFRRPEFHPEFIRKVAVLPFRDNTNGNATIAMNCREVAITQILSSGLFDVVDQMQVDSVLHHEALQPLQPINALTLRRLGQLLGVQAFLIGTVDSAGQQQKGAANFLNLSMTMRLLDSESGLVLWQATGKASGYSFWDRLFGLGGKDAYQVTLELVQRLLASMGQPPTGKAGQPAKAKS